MQGAGKLQAGQAAWRLRRSSYRSSQQGMKCTGLGGENLGLGGNSQQEGPSGSWHLNTSEIRESDKEEDLRCQVSSWTRTMDGSGRRPQLLFVCKKLPNWAICSPYYESQSPLQHQICLGLIEKGENKRVFGGCRSRDEMWHGGRRKLGWKLFHNSPMWRMTNYAFLFLGLSCCVYSFPFKILLYILYYLKKNKRIIHVLTIEPCTRAVDLNLSKATTP